MLWPWRYLKSAKHGLLKRDILSQIKLGDRHGQYAATLALLNSLSFPMHYTYVLQSESDGNFYVGCTKDLKLRFEQHQKGQVESTRQRKPLRLIYYEACLHQEDAFHRERYLKTYNGKRFLHRRLKSYLTG